VHKLKNVFKITFSLVFVVTLFLSPILSIGVNAKNITISQNTFTSGTSDNSIDLSENGKVKLKNDVSSNTVTSKDEFLQFNQNTNPLNPTLITNNNGGEISLNNSFGYNAGTTPTVQNVQDFDYDETLGFLFVAMNPGGVKIIDTKKTFNKDDDIEVAQYTTTSTPSIQRNNLRWILFNPSYGYLYIVTGSGVDSTIDVIDIKDTATQSDDVKIRSFDFTNGYVWAKPVLNKALNDIYIGGRWYGVQTIESNGTKDIGDDVVTWYYNWDMSPPRHLLNRDVSAIYYDEVSHYIYMACGDNIGTGGVSVIDTKGTSSVSDDEFIAEYNTTTTPALSENYVSWMIYYDSQTKLIISRYKNSDITFVIDTKGTKSQLDDTVSNWSPNSNIPTDLGKKLVSASKDSNPNYVYFSTWKGIYLIDTKGTSNLSDDTLVKSYNSNNLPLGVGSLILSPSLNGFFVLGNGISFLSFDKYNSPGLYLSSPVEREANNYKYINWDQTKSNAHSTSVQIRTGTEDSIWIDDFNSNTNSFAGDLYDWGDHFQNVTTENGVITMSNPSTSWGAYVWFDTGKSTGFFPAGSTITAKVRMNNSHPERAYGDWMFTDEWDDGSAYYDIVNDWVYLTLSPSLPFSTIGFEPWLLDYGGWNAEDSFQVDWIKINMPDNYWSNWSSPCSDNLGCEINAGNSKYYQYKINLSTSDLSTSPSINSVTLTNGYEASGVYTSSVIDGSKKVKWTEFNSTKDLPTGTSIGLLTRYGDSLVPDSSWTDWKTFDGSNKSRYVQYKATLSTSNNLVTPTLSMVEFTNQSLSTSTNSQQSSTSSESEVRVLKIKVLDEKGVPVVGAKVELHSEVQIAYTDSEGIATFSNVTDEDHQVIVTYGDIEITSNISSLTSDTLNSEIKLISLSKESSTKSSTLSSKSSSSNSSIEKTSEVNSLSLIIGNRNILIYLFICLIILLVIVLFVVFLRKVRNRKAI